MPAALPVETTGSIFEFCSNDTLASLSRVNSTFHSTAIRVLYRTVVIVSPFRQAIRLLTTLSSNQTAARAVRAFQVDFPPRFCLSSFYNLLRASLRCAAGIIHLGLEVGGPCGYLLSQSTFEPADVCILGNYDEYMNEFFHRQPQIENLVMYPYGPSREVRPIFPVGAFPLLRTIEAPAAFVAAVCSGCPITYAGVIDSDPDSDDVVDIVSKISCCPERLHIVNICVGNGDQFDTIVAGLTRLPLRVLILNVNEWDQVRSIQHVN
jgi:hypothetical protein